MNHKENYIMYSIAHKLVNEYGYEILYLNNKAEEIWLEKYENKASTVLRISTTGFDWKNHLKKDIAIVFQKIGAMRKLLRGKDIKVHNVYISPHTPIDSWEMLKKPLTFQDKKPILMNIYYLTGDDVFAEQKRLEENIGVTVSYDEESITDELMETSIQRYKVDLYKRIQEKQKQDQRIFNYGKPLFTYLLIAINAILYLLVELNGGSQDNKTLIDFGAKYNPLIVEGEWWRIISSMFLHIGFLHFASNMLFLYYFGSLAEKIYGSTRFFIIYMLAGIGGGLASFAFVTNISAGASGALYGLFGAFIYFGIFHRRIFLQTIGRDVLMLLGINILLGFILPQLDVYAHMGGLVAGFMAAGIVHFPKKKNVPLQMITFIIYLVAIIGVCIFGIQHNETDPSYHLIKIDSYLQDEQYEKVVESATLGLKNPGEYKGMLLFQRSYAYIQLNELDFAIADLEQCIQLLENPKDLPEAFSNLAILYLEKGDQRAEEMIEKAYQAKPTDNKMKELYDVIKNNGD
ncbi:rhomboid family intramembrane serine protease [Ornithinibacillus sp. 179-J 7C1 HS]|uniref:rhomboid family intramembrane serine protease n=1 Tax=Ornithinibacillus sp. 179-J 7C1 HS TaxID=3142384 RepID=UPI0039A2F5BD